HPYPGEEPLPGAPPPIGSRVVLRQRPQRWRPVVHDHGVRLPASEAAGRLLVAIVAALGKVDSDDVVGRAGFERDPLFGVYDVIGRRHDVLKAAGLLRVIAQRAEGFDLGHAASEATRPWSAAWRAPGASVSRSGQSLQSRTARGVAQPGSAPAL